MRGRHRNISPLGHLVACGPEAFLSHRTAAAVHGLRAINVRAVEVTVVAAWTPNRRGLIVHRTAQPPAPGEIRRRGLLRFSSVARMFVEVSEDRDRMQDAKLQLIGIRPMRVTDARWECDRADVGEDLIGLLQLG